VIEKYKPHAKVNYAAVQSPEEYSVHLLLLERGLQNVLCDGSVSLVAGEMEDAVVLSEADLEELARSTVDPTEGCISTHPYDWGND